MTTTTTSTPRDARPTSPRFWYALGAVTAAGLILRLYIVFIHRPTASAPGGSVYVLAGDAYFYHWQGTGIADGMGFINPVAWKMFDQIVPSAAHVPLYPLFIASLSFVGLDSVTAHRAASSVLGTVNIVLIALIARKLAGNRAAIIAGGIAALYPELWINDGMLLAEPISVFTVSIAILAAYRFWERRDLVSAAILGGTISLAALARAEQIFLFVILVLPLIYWITREWKRRLQMVGVVAVTGFLVLVPWLAHTATSFEHPVLLTTGTGAVLNAGSCDDAFYGVHIGYYSNCLREDPEGDESERDLQARNEAVDYLEDHIPRIPLVLAARVGRLWGLFKPGQTTALDWSLEGRGRGASWIGLFAFYALMPLAVGGYVVLRRRKVLIWPLLSLAIVVTLAAMTSFGVTRYRTPAEVAVVAGAAVGIDALWRAWSTRRARAAPAPPPPPPPDAVAVES